MKAFIKVIGSDGTSAPVSAAWSEKFKPIATNFPGFVIHVLQNQENLLQ